MARIVAFSYLPLCHRKSVRSADIIIVDLVTPFFVTAAIMVLGSGKDLG